MRITAIEFAGPSKTTLHDGTPGLPRALARASRKGKFIIVELLAPGLDRKHEVQADDEDDIRSMAECLQQTLDGYEGTGSDVHDYYLELLRLSDL